MGARLLNTLLLCGVFGVFSSKAAADEKREFTFGVVPQQAATLLAEHWTPIFSYLSAKTGYVIRFRTAKDFPTFEDRLAKGTYDLAYMNPYHYTVFHRSPGYRVIAKEKGEKLKGVIVVRKDSPYRDIRELAGLELAFPAPTAFAATALPLAHFAQLGIRVRPNYVFSHDSVYLAVAKGLYPAGGGVQRTLDALKSEARNELRVLWETPPYTPHAITAHPRLPAAVIARLQKAMFEMHRDVEGRVLLDRIAIHGIEPAADAEYDDIRKLKLALPR